MGKIFSLIGANGIMQEVKDPDLPIGQILWRNDNLQSKYHHQRQAIYKIDETPHGRLFHCVNLETYELRIHQRPEPDTEVFGIGIHYTPGDVVSQEVIDAALTIALAKKEAETRDWQNAEDARLRRIEVGKSKFDALTSKEYSSYIVAELREDQSDIQQDYFSARTIKTVILCGSKHNRNCFQEFRKAAARCGSIPDIHVLKDAPKEYERREKYSMGAGYYLGKDRYSGWNIWKVRCGSNGEPPEYLFEAAGFDDGFQVV